jgi:hypothetical protein
MLAVIKVKYRMITNDVNDAKNRRRRPGPTPASLLCPTSFVVTPQVCF